MFICRRTKEIVLGPLVFLLLETIIRAVEKGPIATGLFKSAAGHHKKIYRKCYPTLPVSADCFKSLAHLTS